MISVRSLALAAGWGHHLSLLDAPWSALCRLSQLAPSSSPSLGLCLLLRDKAVMEGMPPTPQVTPKAPYILSKALQSTPGEPTFL